MADATAEVCCRAGRGRREIDPLCHRARDDRVFRITEAIVDVIISEDQKLLQDSTRRFLESRSPIASLRRLIDGQIEYDRDVWREGAQQGWIALFVPEEQGGFAESSQGLIDASIVAEELGRVVFAGPFLSASVAAFAIVQSGSKTHQQTLLPGLIGGELVATPCFAASGVDGGIDPGGVRVTRMRDAFVLNGLGTFVQDAAIADYLLVTAESDEGLSQFIVPSNTPGVLASPLETLDLGRRLADVRFADVRIGADALLGEFGHAASQFERQLQVALVLQCAETVGAVGRAFEFTLEWVQERMAFGRPIGSFQALKHRLADHAAQLEGARAAVAHAARAVRNAAPDAAIAVSIAKSQSGRHGTEIVRDCLQMHGGIGMTWEHDIHLYLRRVVSNEALWGAPDAHYERLCRLAGLEEVST
jgi:alkylation response protein AidB-like acyl-CoA dehydrogenase